MSNIISYIIKTKQGSFKRRTLIILSVPKTVENHIVDVDNHHLTAVNCNWLLTECYWHLIVRWTILTVLKTSIFLAVYSAYYCLIFTNIVVFSLLYLGLVPLLKFNLNISVKAAQKLNISTLCARST